MQTDPFKEYLKQQEPDKKYKGYAWQTAIGLQAVDGLKPSEYLVDAAIQNIEGKITLDEVKNLLDSYYEEKPQKNHDRTEEADKVSIRIAKILSEHAFSFTPNEYISIHRKLFTGIYDHAGKIRDIFLFKSETPLSKQMAVLFKYKAKILCFLRFLSPASSASFATPKKYPMITPSMAWEGTDNRALVTAVPKSPPRQYRTFSMAANPNAEVTQYTMASNL